MKKDELKKVVDKAAKLKNILKGKNKARLYKTMPMFGQRFVLSFNSDDTTLVALGCYPQSMIWERSSTISEDELLRKSGPYITRYQSDIELIYEEATRVGGKVISELYNKVFPESTTEADIIFI